MATKKKTPKKSPPKNPNSISENATGEARVEFVDDTKAEASASFNFKEKFLAEIEAIMPEGKELIEIAVSSEMIGLIYLVIHDLPLNTHSSKVPSTILFATIAGREVRFMSKKGIPDRNIISVTSD